MYLPTYLYVLYIHHTTTCGRDVKRVEGRGYQCYPLLAAPTPWTECKMFAWVRQTIRCVPGVCITTVRVIYHSTCYCTTPYYVVISALFTGKGWGEAGRLVLFVARKVKWLEKCCI